MKICSKCGVNPQRKSGSYCPACWSEYQAAWYKANPDSNRESTKRRREEIRKLVIKAKNQPCCDCGQSFPYYVMDLDHVRGEKKFALGVAASKRWSLATVQKEIDKCDVVCANCHRIRTFNKGRYSCV